jgi:hypothetical protein
MKTPKPTDPMMADVRTVLDSLRHRVSELEAAQRMRRIEFALIPVRPVVAGSSLSVPRDATGRFSGGMPTVTPDAMRRAYGTGGLLSPKDRLLRSLLRDFKPTQQ